MNPKISDLTLLEGGIYFTVIFIIIAIMLYTANCALQPRYSSLKHKILSVLLLFASTNIVVLYDYFTVYDPLRFQTLTRVVSLTIFFLVTLRVLYKDRLSKILAIGVISIIVNAVSSYPVYYFSVFAFGNFAYSSEGILSIVECTYQAAVFISMLVVSFFVIRFTKKIPLDVPDRYWIILFAMESFLVLISVILWDNQFSHELLPVQNLYSMFIMLFLLLTGILTIHMFGEITQFYTKEKQHLLLSTQNAALLNQLENETRMNEALRSFKHEINSVLTTIYVLSESGKYDEIRTVISGKLQLLKDRDLNMYTENHMIDALLNLKIAEINKLDIPLETELALLNVELPFSSSDICSILLNLLENAIEASSKLQSEHKPPFIYLKIYIYKNHLCCIVKNAYSGKLIFKNKELATNKSDADLHGYGLKNVEYYVKQYNGIFQYTYTDNEFTAKVMLPL